MTTQNLKRVFVFNTVKEDSQLMRRALRKLRVITSDPIVIISDDKYVDEGLIALVRLYPNVSFYTNYRRLKEFGQGFKWTLSYLTKVLDEHPEVDIITKMDPDTVINSYPYLPSNLPDPQTESFILANYTNCNGRILPHGGYLNFSAWAARILQMDPTVWQDRFFEEYQYAIKGPYRGFNLTGQDVILADLIYELNIKRLQSEALFLDKGQPPQWMYPLEHKFKEQKQVTRMA